MRYALMILVSLGLCACQKPASGGGSGGSAAAPASAPVTPDTYLYRITAAQGTLINGDVYTNFGATDQGEQATGNLAMTSAGYMDFIYSGVNTLGYWALRSSGSIRVQLYRNSTLIDDQMVTINGNQARLDYLVH